MARGVSYAVIFVWLLQFASGVVSCALPNCQNDAQPRKAAIDTTYQRALEVASIAPVVPPQTMLTARDITDTTAFSDPTPTISYNPYSYSIPDYYSYSFPTYSYSIPSITVPSYSIPPFAVPTYTWTAPSITVPDVSYPTAGGSGGKNTDALPGTVTTVMKKINWKKIIGAVVGSVTGFLSLVGGLWAACRRKRRRGGRGGSDEEKHAGALYGRVPSEMGGVGTLPYQQNSGHGRFGSTVHEPLLTGSYYPQHHARFQSGQYMPTTF